MEARGFLEGSTPTAWVRAFKCNSVFVTRYRSLRVPVSIRTSCFKADKQALVDSGATNNFMSPNFARKMGLGMKKLDNPRKIFNIDDTENKSGSITHYLDLDVLTKGIHQESRRGQMQGRESRGGTEIINVLVPLSTMFGYATEIRSRTQGRGSFTMHFSHYEQAPSNVAEEIMGKKNGDKPKR